MRSKLAGCAVLAILGLWAVAAAPAAEDGRAKALASRIKSELRAAENLPQGDAAAARLATADKLIAELKALDAAYPELGVIESRYQRMARTYERKAATPAAPSTAPAAGTPAPDPGPGGAVKQQTRQDWEAIIKLYKDFDARLQPIVPNAKSVIYKPGNIDQVVATIRELRGQVPAIKEQLQQFAAKYGTNVNAIDRKLFELTPLDPRKGMYDAENKRPDDSGGRCYADLLQRMTDLQNAPPYAARIVLNNAAQDVAGIEGFTMDTARDECYAQVEKQFEIAGKLSPDDPEIAEWLAKIRQMRKQSKGDIERALDTARFPAHSKAFQGPGSPAALAKSVLGYVNETYPKEKALVASVAGDWVSAKRNILGETIQWGLPVFVASTQGGAKDVVRVFKMTVLTREERGTRKEPPWADHWTGDSFRMRTKNLPGGE